MDPDDNPGGEHLLSEIPLLADRGNAYIVTHEIRLQPYHKTDCQAVGDHNCLRVFSPTLT
jgi:hypothetical protein